VLLQAIHEVGFLQPVVRVAVAVKGLLKLEAVQPQRFTALDDLIPHALAVLVAEAVGRHFLGEVLDLLFQGLGPRQFGELAFEGARRVDVRQEALQGAEQEDGHDADHQAEAEQQLVANAPWTGHAPTSLSTSPVRHTSGAGDPASLPGRPAPCPRAAESTRRVRRRGEQLVGRRASDLTDCARVAIARRPEGGDRHAPGVFRRATERGRRVMSTNPARSRLRELWQVPTFFLGVLVLTGACLGHPLWRQGQARCLDRRLAFLVVLHARAVWVEDREARVRPSVHLNSRIQSGKVEVQRVWPLGREVILTHVLQPELVE
jgi:hypothetical protein